MLEQKVAANRPNKSLNVEIRMLKQRTKPAPMLRAILLLYSPDG